MHRLMIGCLMLTCVALLPVTVQPSKLTVKLPLTEFAKTASLA